MIIVPTLHPAALLRGASEDDGLSKYEPTVVDDLKKALRLTRFAPTWDESMLLEQDASGRPWRLFPNTFEVRRFFDALYCAFARHPEAVETGDLSLVIDVETTKDSPLLSKLICIGLGFKAPDEEQAINIPILCQGGASYWDDASLAWVKQLCAAVFADTRVPKTFHNKGFDKTVLWANEMTVFGWCWDTMAAHHCEDAELPHNLAYVVTRNTDARYWKDDSKGDEGFLGIPDYTLRLYNLRDILGTMRVAPILNAKLRGLGLWNLYIEELTNIEVMVRATMRGLLVDETRRSSVQPDKDGKPIGLGPRLELQRAEATQMLRVISNDQFFAPGKPLQVAKLLFNDLGMPVVKTTKTGKAAVDREALMLLELVAQTPTQKQAIKALISYRQADKLLGTFVYGLPINPKTGRVHPLWKLLAVSGRYTTNPNAQNWSKRVKGMFRAAHGFKLVAIDMSQAELRYIAYLANDTELLRMYRDGINVHTVNASLLFKVKCPPEEVDHINPQTEAYLREAVPRFLGPQYNYDSFPVVPRKKWKLVRTLAKNFAFGCVERGTKVAVLDSRGSVPIEQVKAGDWTWCWDGAAYTPTRVKRVVCHGRQECVTLTLRAGDGERKTVTVTPDHPMLTRDGRYVEAGALQPGTRLMPFRRYEMQNGYREIDPFNDGGRAYEHRHVLGGDSAVVHHRDGDKLDNAPSNLEAMTHAEHRGEHPPEWTDGRRAAQSVAAREAMTDARKEMLAEARRKSERFIAHASALGRVTAAKAREAHMRKAQAKSCSSCGGKPHFAKGLCQRCYNRNYRKRLPNHVVEKVERVGVREVWDLEVEHEAHNFALDRSVFVGNCNYGAEAETVHSVLRSKRDDDGNLLFPDLLLSEIQALRVLWTRVLHPAIARWWDDVQMHTKKANGFHCPISGRVRWFRGGFKRNEMLNFPIQTGVASWMNKCMVEIQNIFDAETGGLAQIIQQVHDALVCEVPEWYAQRAADVMQWIINRPFALPGFPQATLPADPAIIATHLDRTG